MTEHQRERYMHLGGKIAFYRKKRNMSQAELACAVKTSRTHISRIETAACSLSLDLLFEICDVLKIRPERLFDRRL